MSPRHPHPGGPASPAAHVAIRQRFSAGREETYRRLVEATVHVQNRAWTGLYNFLTANSILVLGWATLFAGTEKLDLLKSSVLLGISAIGIVTGLLWALLGIRTWEWSLRIDDHARDLQNKIAALAPLAGVAEEIHKRWFAAKDVQGFALWEQRLIGFSSNPWVLFLAPILLAFLHMVMLTVIAFSRLQEWRWLVSLCDLSPHLALLFAWIVFVFIVQRTWKQCSPVLHWKHGNATPVAS